MATLAPFGPSGGSLCSLLSWLVWGILFHRFGRCGNHDDFLEEFVFQSAPKLVSVTLALFRPLGGNTDDGLGQEIVDQNSSADGLGAGICILVVVL